MLAELTRNEKDYTREDLKKVEKQKKIIYQKIAIIMSMKNISDITKDKLEVVLRKSGNFTDGELDLVFGKSITLKEEENEFFNRDIEFIESETPSYMRARELKQERERENVQRFGFVPEYI